MSDNKPQNLKATDQSTESKGEKTPEPAKESGVIAGQPNQDVHRLAFDRAHVEDKNPSGIMPALHENLAITGNVTADDMGKKTQLVKTEKQVSEEKHPAHVMPALTPEVEERIRALRQAKREQVFESATHMAIEASSNPAMQPVALARQYADSLPDEDPRKKTLTELSREMAAEYSPKMREHYEGKALYGHIEKTDSEPGNGWAMFTNLTPDQQKSVIAAFEAGSLTGQNQYTQTIEAVSESIPKGFYNVGKSLYDCISASGKFVHDIYLDHDSAIKTGGAVGEALGQAIVTDVRAFQFLDNYRKSIEQSGDFTKPFRDLQTVGEIIDERWKAMPLEVRTEKGSELIAGLGLGSAFGSVDKIAKSGKLIDTLEELGGALSELGGKAKEKAAREIGKLVDELLQPVGETGMGYKMPIPKKRTIADTNVLMSKADDLGEGRPMQPEDRMKREPIAEKLPPSKRFISELQQVVEGFSVSERNFLKQFNIVIKPVRRITDIFPDIKTQTAGCFDASEKTIHLAEEVFSKGKWVPNNDLPFMARHEFGHAYNAKVDAFGDFVSNFKHFRAAFRDDFQTVPPDVLDALQLSRKYRTPELARDEVFADLYAHAQGLQSNNSYSQLIKQWFPNSLKFVEEMPKW